MTPQELEKVQNGQLLWVGKEVCTFRELSSDREWATIIKHGFRTRVRPSTLLLEQTQANKRGIRVTVTDAPCKEACWYATGKVCMCSCGGENHGIGHNSEHQH